MIVIQMMERRFYLLHIEEVNKIAGLLDDLRLDPTTPDVRSLATIRFLENTMGLEEKMSYLISEWTISGVYY